jgi:hypothetical protein
MDISIDYSAHPAFAPHIPRQRPDPGPADLFFDRLDDVVRSVQSRGQSLEGLAPAMRDITRDFLGSMEQEPLPDDTRKLVEAAATLTADRFAVETANRSRGLFFENSRGNPVVGRLISDGFIDLQLEESELQDLHDAMSGEMRNLEARRAAGEKAQLIGRANLRAMRILRRFFGRTGVEEALTQLYATPMSLEGFALVLSHPNDRWYHSPYADVGLATTRTVQMHYDEDYWAPKSMLYLNDVRAENGAFCLHPSSHRWPKQGSRLEWRKRLGYGIATELTSRGLQPVGRSIFAHPEARKWFAKLPASMQMTDLPGNDVLDGTPLSEALLRAERSLEGGPGSAFVFTGHDVLHRGGIVSNGERWALQIVFRPTPTLRKRAYRLTGSAIRRLRSWFK